jgi:hypothetical protein
MFVTSRGEGATLMIRQLCARTTKPTWLLSLLVSEDQYVSIDRVPGWSARNPRICATLTAIIESAADRVMVVIGAGHLPLLFAPESPLACVGSRGA